MLLQVDNLKTYLRVGKNSVKAVDGISFSIDKGEIFCLVGESGSGKSITALSIIQLIPKDICSHPDGRIIFRGGDLDESGTREALDMLTLDEEKKRQVCGARIAMIFQEPMTSLNPVYTVGDQIAEAIVLHQGKSKKEALELAADMLDLVGIPEPHKRLKNYPHQMSGGMRQRVMIAMGLSCNPKLLIADEPTTALDVTIQAQIIDLVKRLRDELGMAVIWITHDLAVVAGLAQRVIVMYAGQIIEKANVRDIYYDPRHPYTLGLLNSIPRLDMVGRRLEPIEGLPPDLLALPKGCPFAPRCRFRIDRCLEENPPLEPVAPGHEVACWVDVRTGRPR